MLFFSNAKYPEENGWETYLSSHGGSSNASTDCEQTIYQFDVHPQYLDDALDRFAQFFISPLFSPDAADREILAVDSEFKMSLQSDSSRHREVLCASSHPTHPASKFGWGNSKSLDADIKHNGVDIRAELLRFHSTYYSANCMKLVVLGTDLDALQATVVKCFTPIVNTGRPLVSFQHLGSPWGAQALGHVFDIRLVRDLHELELFWPLPCLSSRYRSQPTEYYGNLVGHEGAGSLCALLKKWGWALDLSAGCGNSGADRGSSHWVFTVTVTLTQEGFRHADDVVGLIYCYLNMLRQVGPQKGFWEELKASADMEFRFQDKVDNVDYVEELALNLHMYRPEHVLTGDAIYVDWDEEELMTLLGHLTPYNCRMSLLSKDGTGNPFAPGTLVLHLIHVS
jgi:nardilysin